MAGRFETVRPVACAAKDFAKRHVLQLLQMDDVIEWAKEPPPSSMPPQHQVRIDAAKAAREWRP